MGVHGLWHLLQPTGKPVTLESLEGKVLAVDVSIWFNQALKGMRDEEGRPLHNAHLHSLFNRVCKLLYYKIKPVFVFDGGVPVLKKQTLTARRQRKFEATESSEKAAKKLLKNLLKHNAISAVLGSGTSTSRVSNVKTQDAEPDMYSLPQTSTTLDSSTVLEEDDLFDAREAQRREIYAHFQNLHDIDIDSEDFKLFPPEVQHEILTELKEVRKERAQGKRLVPLPEESDDFSSYQIGKIMKQSKLSRRIEGVRKEMNKQSAGDIVEAIGGDRTNREIISSRVASEDSSHYVLIKGFQQSQETDVQDAAQAVRDIFEKKKTKIKCEDVSNDTKLDEKGDNKLASIDEVGEENESTDIQDVQHDSYVELKSSNIVKADKLLEKSVTKSSPNKMYQKDGDFSISPRKMIQVDKVVLSEDEEENGRNKKENVVEMRVDDKEIGINVVEIEECTENTEVAYDFSNEGGFCREDDSGSEKKHTNEKLSDKKSEDLKTESDNVTNDQPILSDDELLISEVMKAESNLQAKFSNVTPKNDSASQLNKADVGDVQRPEVRNTDTEESDEDEGFIEVAFDPKTAVPDDDLFPASIFEPANHSTLIDKSTNQVSSQHLENNSNEIKPIMIESDDNSEEPITDLVTNTDNVEEPMNENVAAYESDEYEPITEQHASLTNEELRSMQSDIQLETAELQQERGRQERLAASVSEQMSTEAQELLGLFGLPYLVSPMEAEAQCAFLEQTGQVDGTITDDSDIWLFGGHKVYRNFFNQDKMVETFTFDDIKNKLLLNRSKLVNLALLCGSDYTEGIYGIGPVHSMELMAEFPGKGIDSLKRFKEWWDKAQKQGKPPQETPIKKRLRTFNVHEGFPSQAVVDAYLHPTVDESMDTFTWGTPDLDLLRDFATHKLYWTKVKTDDLVLPVLKRLNDHTTQSRITNFFVPGLDEKRNVKSKRVKRALKTLKTDKSSHPKKDSSSDEADVVLPVKRKRKIDSNINKDSSLASSNCGGFVGGQSQPIKPKESHNKPIKSLHSNSQPIKEHISKGKRSIKAKIASTEVILSEDSSNSDSETRKRNLTRTSTNTKRSISKGKMPIGSKGKGKHSHSKSKSSLKKKHVPKEVNLSPDSCDSD